MKIRIRLIGAFAVAMACSEYSSRAKDPIGGSPAAAVSLLRERFPAQSKRVLGEGGEGFVLGQAQGERGREGFTARPPMGLDVVRAAEAAMSRSALRMQLPRRGDGEIRFETRDGFALKVREVGEGRSGRLEGGAVVYERPGVTSFWSVASEGYEEWLLIDRMTDEIAARWEVAGGTLRQAGDGVEVLDEGGVARIRVSAPAAFEEGGKEARAWLVCDRGVIALHTEARGTVLVDPLWTTTGAMATARQLHTATLLTSGKVLVVGGQNAQGLSLATAEVYDPATGTFTATTGPLSTARYFHTATLLPSGKVLVAGGWDTDYLATAEVYDPVAGTFTATTGPLLGARGGHTATLLLSGKVLVAGGSMIPGTVLATAEIYDPAAGTFKATTGPLARRRSRHTATLLPSGKVLVVGGYDGADYLATAEVYDPVAGTFTATTGSLANRCASHTATLLPSGKVLVAGGKSLQVALAAAEIYDPAAGTFRQTTGALATARYDHAATLLPSGKVLVAGGKSLQVALATAEVYDPVADAFTAAGTLGTARYSHIATLLPSGKVLVAGGHGTLTAILATAEVYDPAAGTFTATTGPMGAVRYGHTATLLPSGKVLVVGGRDQNNAPVQAVVHYDPVASTFTATGPLATARYGHTATLLPSGKVLVAGGNDPKNRLATAEVYDPSAGTFTATTGSLANARDIHTATLLPSGKVLVAGGFGTTDYLARVETYDPKAGTFTETLGPTTATERYAHTATLLPSGKVLVAGGYGRAGPLATAEVYDPSAGTFTATKGSLATARFLHTATLLPSGKVLVAGGSDHASPRAVAEVEVYDPATGTFTAAGTLGTARYSHTATLLLSGKVLVAGAAGAIATTEVYDPVAGTFTATVPLATARRGHTATLLLSGKVLVAGGGVPAVLATAEVYDEGRGGQLAWTPSISSAPVTIAPGALLPVIGTLFTGVSEGSGGSTASSATNYPLLLLQRVDNEASVHATSTAWTSTSATFLLPVSLQKGPYLAWVVVNGVLSNGTYLLVGCCGSDCVPCSTANASATTCSGDTAPAATACSPTCNTGFQNQDANGANGCEACSVTTACGTDCLACAATNTTKTACIGNIAAAATSCTPTCFAGYANGDGNGANGCESLICRNDNECGSGWCVAAKCVPRLANGAALPSTCTPSLAVRACASGACDTKDNKCGVALGNGTCSSSAQCRSGVCVTSGPNFWKCKVCNTGSDCSGGTPACTDNSCAACNGNFASTAKSPCPGSASPFCNPGTGTCNVTCQKDSDCGTGKWCSGTGGYSICKALHPNGALLFEPCTPSIGSRACASGACEVADNKCGVALGNGPCSSSAQCRSGVCVTSGPNNGKCKVCNTGSDCSGATPACTDNSCAACDGNFGSPAKSPCALASPFCNLSTGTCNAPPDAGVPPDASAAGLDASPAGLDASSDASSSELDASPPSADAAADAAIPAVDAGTTSDASPDAPMPADASDAGPDASPAGPDASSDASSSEPDASPPAVDASLPAADAALPDVDARVPPDPKAAEGSQSPYEFVGCGCSPTGSGPSLLAALVAVVAGLGRRRGRKSQSLRGILVAAAASLGLLSSANAAGPVPKRVKVAVLDIKTVGTFEPKTVQGLSALIASTVEQHDVQVLSGADIATLVGFEKQKQLLGCTESSCLAEIGGALGAEYLLTTEIAQVGDIWLISMSLLDVVRSRGVRRTSKQADNVRDLVRLCQEGVRLLMAPVLDQRKAAAAAVTIEPAPQQKTATGAVTIAPSPQPKAVPEAARSDDPKLVVEVAKPRGIRPFAAVRAMANPGKGFGFEAGAGVLVGGIGASVHGVLGRYKGLTFRGLLLFPELGAGLTAHGSLDVPVFFVPGDGGAEGGVLPGAGAAAGLSLDATAWLRPFVEIAGRYYFTRPDAAQAIARGGVLLGAGVCLLVP